MTHPSTLAHLDVATESPMDGWLPTSRAATSYVDAFRKSPARFVDVGHSQLAYYRFGAGPDLVFVHGWPLHAATFRDILPSLAQRFTCHLLDLPKTGQTQSQAHAPMDLVSHAQTVRSAIDGLGLGSCALLAHDTGAVVARLVAADDSRVSALILSGTEIPGHQPGLVKMYAMLSRLPGGSRALTQLLRFPAVRRSALGFKGCFHNIQGIEGDFHSFFVAPLLADAGAADGQMALLRNLDFSVIDGLGEVHRRITAPTLLIWGDDDPFFPVSLAAAMAKQFSGETVFRSLPNAKLYVHEEYPAQFARACCEFIDAHPAPAKPS